MLKISIVTSSYNQAKYLAECLRSVKEQNYPNIEHIVVDGGSADGSVEILREYAAKPGWHHLTWISEPDRGQSDALNKGFQKAQGDVIGWLNSDDFYLEKCFENVAQVFAARPHPDVVYGDYLWINEITGTYQVRREISFSAFVLLHTPVPYINSSGALFIARRVIDEGHLLNLGLHNSMDYEYYLRLYRKGFKFYHLPKLMGALRLHSSCKSDAHKVRAIEELERTRRENLTALGMLHPGKGQELRLALLRCLANGRRWSEKALRGYYFTQYRPNWLRRVQVDPRRVASGSDVK